MVQVSSVVSAFADCLCIDLELGPESWMGGVERQWAERRIDLEWCFARFSLPE